MPFDKNVAGPLTRLLFVSRPQTIPTLSLSDALFLLGCHRLRRRDRAYEPQPCPRCARASVISGFDLRRRAKEVAAAFRICVVLPVLTLRMGIGAPRPCER